MIFLAKIQHIRIFIISSIDLLDESIVIDRKKRP